MVTERTYGIEDTRQHQGECAAPGGTMKKVAVIGAGWMTKQLVDYSMEKCGFYVIMANRTLSKAEARSIQVLGRT
jgi:glutamyl-tRNA reductase